MSRVKERFTSPYLPASPRISQVVMSRVKERFITGKGLPPFIAALSQCMWAREHRELLARKKRKDAAEAGMRRDEGRDWERLIHPPIPERATLAERAKWRDKGETFHGEAVDSGEVVQG